MVEDAVGKPETSMATVLSRVLLFAGLKDNREALEALSQLMVLTPYNAGVTLIEEGTLGDQFFVLIEGQVSIFKKTPDGDSYKVAILKQEMTPAIGEGGLVEAEPRSATVKTDINCKFLVLSRDGFGEFCSKNPAWALPILQKISVGLMGRLRQTSNDLMLLHKALMNEIRG
jgi:CRP/FNR family transcriptional regulator, cyclic AMP receptor protein